MISKNDLMAYAIDFVSYLISKQPNIDRIILHGSVARDDFDGESDVDLFIDTKYNLQEKIEKIVQNYGNTENFKIWGLKGIKNIISIVVGDLDSKKWKDLKRGIINTGIILYGKYKAEAEKINQYVLFSFENIKPDKKRVLIYRKLFGFKQGNKKYSGLVEKIKAVKVGKGSILVPIEHVNEFKSYLQKMKVSFKLYDLWSDSKIEM